MLHVPIAAWVHPSFDAAAWLAGLATSASLYRWRLRLGRRRPHVMCAWYRLRRFA